LNIFTVPMNLQPTILIVDDNHENLVYLKYVTFKLNVNIIQAHSGYKALEKTRGKALALAIIDVQMPGMNGYELALKLNEDRLDDKVPVIFLTASHINEMEEFKGYSSGAVDYIFKPVTNHILLSKITVFLNLFEQKLTILQNTEKLKETTEELKSSLLQLQQLSQYIEQVRENERIAISRELHDDLGQSLTAVKIDLGIIKQKITDNEIILRINKVTTLVGDTIKTVQRITSQLRPDIIDDLGLEAAIDWYANEFAQRMGIKVFLDMDSSIELSPDASLIVFRIMQESLTNVARHSKATRVDIVLSKSEENILLSITDNGIGISEKQRNAKDSFGLISMKERSASLHGTFDISNSNGSGTVIKLWIPLDKILAQ
jgi:signal transduction histidine kinase